MHISHINPPPKALVLVFVRRRQTSTFMIVTFTVKNPTSDNPIIRSNLAIRCVRLSLCE
jgi:hypothetical protein